MIYKDVGKEIKDIAEGYVWSKAFQYGFIGLIAVVAIIGMFAGSVGPAIAPGLIAGFVAGFVGYRVRRRQALMVYAWGELVDRVISLERKLSGDCERKTVKVKKAKISPDGQIIHHDEPVENEATDDEVMDGEPVATRFSDGRWKCAYCECINAAGVKACTNCGIVPNFK